jgi:hypothetical protein
MERRFSVEAKSFSFSVVSGKPVLRLEERRKGFKGFILLGVKASVWLADTVEEACETQKREDFARSLCDEVRVLKVRMGRNRAGSFLEAAVFVEGGRKGVIRLPEGRGGWGWRRFAEELRPLTAHLDTKVLPAVACAGEEGCQPSFAEVLAAPLGGMKSPGVEGLASILGSWTSMGGGAGLTEVLRSLAMEFLAKLRTEVDRILFFGLGLKIKATRDTRRRMVQVLSRLGLKPKLLIGRTKYKRKASGLVLRPKSLAKPKAGNGATESEVVLDGPEVSEKTSEKASETAPASVGQSGSSELCCSGEIPSESEEIAPEMDPALAPVPVPGKDALNRSSPETIVGVSVLLGCTQIVPATSLNPIPVGSPWSSTEGVVESLGPMGSTQIVPGTILTATEAADLPEKTSPEGVEVSQIPMDPTQPVLLSPELAQTAPVLILPEFPGTVEVSEGSVSSATVPPVPKAQLSVHGLTETQAWLLGWLRDGTRNHALLGVIGCFEVGTRRRNVVAPPPVCSEELPKLKAKLAGIRDEDRENVVRNWALSIAASLGIC